MGFKERILNQPARGGAVEGGWINGLVEVGALWMRTKSHRAERV